MIKAVLKDGVLQPLKPVPAESTDGRPLWVEEVGPVEPSAIEDSEDLDEWYRKLQELGPAQYEPGEREEVQRIMAEADQQTKRGR